MMTLPCAAREPQFGELRSLSRIASQCRLLKSELEDRT
jgi:hypothetical protein